MNHDQFMDHVNSRVVMDSPEIEKLIMIMSVRFNHGQRDNIILTWDKYLEIYKEIKEDKDGR